MHRTVGYLQSLGLLNAPSRIVLIFVFRFQPEAESGSNPGPFNSSKVHPTALPEWYSVQGELKHCNVTKHKFYLNKKARIGQQNVTCCVSFRTKVQVSPINKADIAIIGLNITNNTSDVSCDQYKYVYRYNYPLQSDFYNKSCIRPPKQTNKQTKPSRTRSGVNCLWIPVCSAIRYPTTARSYLSVSCFYSWVPPLKHITNWQNFTSTSASFPLSVFSLDAIILQ